MKNKTESFIVTEKIEPVCISIMSADEKQAATELFVYKSTPEMVKEDILNLFGLSDGKKVRMGKKEWKPTDVLEQPRKIGRPRKHQDEPVTA